MALRPFVTIGDAVDPTILDRLPSDLPELVRAGVASLFAEPLGIQEGGQPLAGGHRMTAMKKQGLRYAFGMR
jgi:ParB-like chromosome segregation protein Spo0J